MVSPQFKAGLGLLALRVGLAGILLSHGALKIVYGAAEWDPDLPAAVQAAVAWAEALAGALLLFGLLTRLASVVVIAVQAGAIVLVTGRKGLIEVPAPARPGPDYLAVQVGFEYNLALIAMCVALLFLGSGVIALDPYVRRRRRPAPDAGAPRAAPPALTPPG
jgi:uncharacterized membrane protein YphA (DoxX/SURF4 family)